MTTLATGAHVPAHLVDAYAIDTLDEDAAAVTAHLESCGHCRARVERAREVHGDFLRRYPTLAALRPTPAPSRWARLSWWPVPAAALAAAVLVIAVLPREESPRERLKGGGAVELVVARGGDVFSFAGEPLRAGDVLLFRHSSRHTHAIAVSLEASGRVQLVLAADGRSVPITPGERVELGHGIELDDYRGPERIVLLLTDAPLAGDAVLAAVRAAAGGGDAPTVGRLPFEGEQHSWLLIKEQP